MKKGLFIVAMLAATVSFGQKKATTVNYSAGVQACVPTSKTADAFKTGLGASVSATCHPNKKVDFNLTAGVVHFESKFGTEKLVQVPLTIGANYKVCSVARIGAEAGISCFNQDMGTWFTFAPVVTYTVKKFDIAARYTTALRNVPAGNDFTNVSLTVSYKF